MSYCTLTDLTSRYGTGEITQLTDRDHTGAIDTAVADRAIADAAGEIDGYLRQGGYDLPLASVPAVLTAYACDIARYRLYDQVADEVVVMRYKAAIRFLRDLAAGSAALDSAGPDEPVGEVEFDAGRNVFAGGGW